LGPLTMTILQRDLVAGIQVSRFATSLYLKWSYTSPMLCVQLLIVHLSYI
jgi:hypothetical protein